MPKFKGEYGVSENGNFWVDDTIPVTHPFVVTSAHVNYASEKCGGILDDQALRQFPCGHCRKPYKEHETALVVRCKVELKDAEGKANAELHEYLLACKPICEANGYAGFAFMKAA